jgi:hypothetical protein
MAHKWRMNGAEVAHNRPRPVRKRLFLVVFGAAVSVCVAGCLPPQTREDVQRDWDKGVADWQATDWNHMLNQVTGLPLAPESPGRAEGVADDNRLLCLNRNSEERVISENGVSDYVQYRRCPVSPYPTRSLGGRLSPGHIDPIEPNDPLN